MKRIEIIWVANSDTSYMSDQIFVVRVVHLKEKELK